MSTSASEQTKTIPQFLAEAPDVDSHDLWERFWEVLTDIKERVTAVMPVEQHHSSAGLDYYKAGDQGYEGSLNTYTSSPDPQNPDAPRMDWFVHSWIGNRSASILDMNINVWLGPEIDVPHLVLVFGTLPRIFHYSDLIARRDLTIDVDYLNRYYGDEANAQFLDFRSDDRFAYSVSHGPYMRAVASPNAYSFHAERSDEIREYVISKAYERFESWLELVKNATPVPAEERAALAERDRQLRTQCYSLDPMNELSAKFIGEDKAAELVAKRRGALQIDETRGQYA